MIQKIIYNYLDDKSKIQKEKDKEHILHWSPSYFCSCMRKKFYEKTNMEITNPTSIHTLLKFEMGHGIHYQLKELYKNIEKFYKQNPKENFKFKYIENENNFIEKIFCDIKFVYKPDDIINVNEKIFLIENKTKYGAGIDALKFTGIEQDYEIQLLLYMIFEDIEYGELFFIATDSSFNQDFSYTKENLLKKYEKYLNDRCEKIKECLQEIQNFYDKKEYKIPGKEGQINIKKFEGKIKTDFQYKNEKYKSYPCAWGDNKCSYFNLCWQKELQEFENFNYYINNKFIKE